MWCDNHIQGHTALGIRTQRAMAEWTTQTQVNKQCGLINAFNQAKVETVYYPLYRSPIATAPSVRQGSVTTFFCEAVVRADGWAVEREVVAEERAVWVGLVRTRKPHMQKKRLPKKKQHIKTCWTNNNCSKYQSDTTLNTHCMWGKRGGNQPSLIWTSTQISLTKVAKGQNKSK